MLYPIPRTFDTVNSNWRQDVTESGSVVLSSNNRVATCSSQTTTDKGLLFYNLSLQGGTHCRFSVMAKDLQLYNGSAEITIDAPKGSARNTVVVDSPHWRRYSLDYTVPITTEIQEVSFVIGSYTGPFGAAKYANPELELTNTSHGALRTLMAGLLAVTNTGASMNQGYYRNGIESVTWNAAAKQIEVAFAGPLVGTFGPNKPLMFVQGTPDSIGPAGPAVLPIIWVAGSIFSTANKCLIVPFRPDGSRFDITTLPAGVSLYVFFELRG
jgi:hypothetical protein